MEQKSSNCKFVAKNNMQGDFIYPVKLMLFYFLLLKTMTWFVLVVF